MFLEKCDLCSVLFLSCDCTIVVLYVKAQKQSRITQNLSDAKMLLFMHRQLHFFQRMSKPNWKLLSNCTLHTDTSKTFFHIWYGPCAKNMHP